MPDVVVYNLGFMLGASKRADYRQACRGQCAALVGFLQENGLVRSSLVAAGQVPDDDFMLRESQLTEEGVLLMRNALRPWMRAQEKSDSKEDVSLLSAGLDKIRRSES